VHGDETLKGYFDMASTTTETTVGVHPLDPLSAAEIARAWEIVRTEHALGPRVRVISIGFMLKPSASLIATPASTSHAPCGMVTAAVRADRTTR